MKKEKLKQEFREVVKGGNFVTPIIIDFIKIKNGVCELSTGIIFGKKVYGVTVVINKKHEYDLSKLFTTKEEAIEYVETLK